MQAAMASKKKDDLELLSADSTALQSEEVGLFAASAAVVGTLPLCACSAHAVAGCAGGIGPLLMCGACGRGVRRCRQTSLSRRAA